uniref:L1 transposable element RRM domain-containing protein n=1 Tax=Latimeria chalumnae TaxID=7897 RepID=H3AJZ0_LATCH
TTSATLVELKDLISGLNHRVASEEQRVSNVEDAQQNLNREVTELKKTNIQHDQENRAQRNNVRIVGFPEGVEHGRPIKFLQETLLELLKLPSGTSLEVERAHRSLAPKPAEGQRPRPFIVRFLRYPVREQILTAARSLGTLEWNGSRILMFPDLLRDLMERQQRFMLIKKALRGKGLKYGLFYPATLKLTCDGKTRSFTEPKAVEEFLQRRKESKRLSKG